MQCWCILQIQFLFRGLNILTVPTEELPPWKYAVMTPLYLEYCCVKSIVLDHCCNQSCLTYVALYYSRIPSVVQCNSYTEIMSTASESEEHFDEFEHYNFDQEKAMNSGHSGKQRTKKEAEQNTNRHNPGGHERKIATKLMNMEKNQKDGTKSK